MGRRWMVIEMKTDIIYTIKSENNEFKCIDEMMDNNEVIHHTNGGLFLMDNPNDTELKSMISFSNTNQCSNTIKNLKENESKNITFNGYDFTIIVKGIREGGFFKEWYKMNPEIYNKIITEIINNKTTVNEMSNYHRILCYLNNEDYKYDQKDVIGYISDDKFLDYELKFNNLSTDQLESLADDLIDDKIITHFNE